MQLSLGQKNLESIVGYLGIGVPDRPFERSGANCATRGWQVNVTAASPPYVRNGVENPTGRRRVSLRRSKASGKHAVYRFVLQSQACLGEKTFQSVGAAPRYGNR